MTLFSLQTESIVPIQENKIILILSVTVLLVVMNTTMFNVALPSIIIDFSLNSLIASWLVSGYSTMFAIHHWLLVDCRILFPSLGFCILELAF